MPEPGSFMNPVRTIDDALLTRRDCTAFLPTPVARGQVERLLALSARSASNSNCQPWQVHVLTGAAERALTADIRAHDFTFFGAPVAIILTVSRGPLRSALLDAGLFLQALMVAARATGLHTCTQAAPTDLHPILRRHVNIPEDHVIICGVALGHADDRHLIGSPRPSPEPATSFTTFYDSDSA
jgi:nitroreductase